MRDLRLSEPNDYNIFLHLDGPSFDELLKITPVIANRFTNMREAVTLGSVYPLRYAI
jgi:hypothetical protein